MRTDRPVSWMVLWIFLPLVGCASLTPAQLQALRDGQAFADATAEAYGLGHVRVVAGSHSPGVGATFRRGVITLDQTFLISPFLDVLMAHELGHAALGHEGPVPLQATQLLTQRELDANAKGVEILVRVIGKTRAEALHRVLEFLLSIHSSLAARERVDLPVGHPPPCAQIEDLLRRFPDHQYSFASLGCATDRRPP